jgi:Chlorophyll A-B binding protein
MKLAILASLIASAFAFTPVAKQGSMSSTSLKAISFDDKPGALPPLGYWDPLGLATSEKLFDQYRAVELKHARVAMLAVIGYVVPEFYRFGYEFTSGVTCSTVRNGVAAFKDIPPLGWVQMIFLVGFIDQTGFLGNFEIVSLTNADSLQF